MSTRKFSMVSPAIWRPGRFLSLAEPGAQLLYLYYLTCEHQTSAGCFRLPDGYACADLGWPLTLYAEMRARLIDADLIAFDAATNTIYVLRWFQHCGAMSDKHATGIAKVISSIESDTIREMVEADFLSSEAERNNSKNTAHNALQNHNRLLSTGLMTGRGAAR